MKSLRNMMFLILLAGCAVNPAPVMPVCPPLGVEHGAQWYSQDAVYRLRHEGVLQFGSMTIPMTGFMDLDTGKGEARVVILTSMGIKLLSLEVTKDTYEVVYSSSASQRIPGFIEQSAASIQSVFLNDFIAEDGSCFVVDNQRESVEKSASGMMRVRRDLQTGFVVQKNFKSGKTVWTVYYEGAVDVDGVIFPEKVTFADRTKRYTVILQLKSAKKQ